MTGGLGLLPVREFVARHYGVDMTVGEIAIALEIDPEVVLHVRPPQNRSEHFVVARRARLATFWDAY